MMTDRKNFATDLTANTGTIQIRMQSRDPTRLPSSASKNPKLLLIQQIVDCGLALDGDDVSSPRSLIRLGGGVEGNEGL